MLNGGFEKEAEHPEPNVRLVLADSYNALSDHLNTEEKQREFANNYWEHVHRTVK